MFFKKTTYFERSLILIDAIVYESINNKHKIMIKSATNKIIFNILVWFIILILILSGYAFGQDKSLKLSLPNPSEVIYTSDQVTSPPQFKGGKNALDTFIKRNFNVKVTKKGEISVAFIVEKDGKLSEIGVLNDAGPGTADEGIRVMGLSPKWKPGILNGNPVRVQFLVNIPVVPN